MIVLATGAITARTEDDRVVATIQSGRDIIEVSLSFHQACQMATTLLKEAVVTLDASAKQADVIAFPGRIKRPRQRKASS